MRLHGISSRLRANTHDENAAKPDAATVDNRWPYAAGARKQKSPGAIYENFTTVSQRRVATAVDNPPTHGFRPYNAPLRFSRKAAERTRYTAVSANRYSVRPLSFGFDLRKPFATHRLYPAQYSGRQTVVRDSPKHVNPRSSPADRPYRRKRAFVRTRETAPEKCRSRLNRIYCRDYTFAT